MTDDSSAGLGAGCGLVPGAAAWCEHGTGYHDGGVPSAATAPTGSRAWLLIGHSGPWAAEAVATALPGSLAKLALRAEELGIRVQLIRRSGARRDAPDDGRVFAAWVAGDDPWVTQVTADSVSLEDLAAGERPAGTPERDGLPGTPAGPMYLVCAHGKRDRCCARYGAPLARALTERHPQEVWETTHVGGHKFAANLVLLPHGLYYGPCDLASATAAIDAYRDGHVATHRYRGRAGEPS